MEPVDPGMRRIGRQLPELLLTHGPVLESDPRLDFQPVAHGSLPQFDVLAREGSENVRNVRDS